MANGCCRMHHGTAPVGIANGAFKTGAQSKYLAHLPATLKPHFDLSGQNLMQLTEELGVIEATITALLESMKAAPRITAEHRKQLADQFDRKARLVAVESRRRKDEHDMVERSEFARFTKVLLLAIAAHVDDPRVRGKIQADVLRVLAISQVPHQLAEANG